MLAPPWHERYEQVRLLGSGGAGTVYLVRDRETGEQLALKRLLRADNQGLLRLKREFRSLADIHHPNLVKLYELGQDDVSAFFTMEYIEGEELRHYLAASRPSNDNCDPGRLARVFDVFVQLADAVQALHRAGVLHRDLKPSNVMVAAGRAVLLDFGIAVEVGDSAATVTADGYASGTPAYMAPEQIQGKHLGEPNDWYAFGVMLYEALSGRLPIEGTLAELLRRKGTQAPAAIDGLVDGLPSDISRLCMQLLSIAPAARPNGDRVLQVLNAHAHGAATGAKHLTASTSLTGSHGLRTHQESRVGLFGRERELEQLWTAFQSVQSGGFAVVHVFGESGSGKSALVQQFTDEVEHDGFLTSAAQPLVLRTRCHERETLPFKALDGAMDELVSHLMRESDIVVGHALPRDLAALMQLFPTLNRLHVTQRLVKSGPAAVGTSQLRQQAELALRDLLQRRASQRPIVLWIDDLQWGDLDSIGILTSWLKPPYMQQILLVLSYRSEELATSPCLTLLRQRTPEDASVQTMLPLRKLDDEHVRALCKERFVQEELPDAAQDFLIERIVREAEGSPFLASQLVTLALSEPSQNSSQLGRLSLEQLVRSRIRPLSAAARRALSMLSVAARPLSLALLLQASELQHDSRAVVHELQGAHLIRTRNMSDGRLVEVYHDRLREVLRGMLTGAERKELDRKLFATLLRSGSADNDWLHMLALSVDDRPAALHYGLAAAQRASDSLAFERAAELYERCVALSDTSAADSGALQERLAQAYARAGHGAKAALTYQQAAHSAEGRHRSQLERAAASHLLCTGRFDEGEALLRKVLTELGLDAPSSEAGLYAALAWERLRLSVRGLDYTPRSRSEVSDEVYYRAELCGLVSIETASYDPLRAALFQARCLRMSLDAGEPTGVARSLCAAATLACVSGSERAIRRAEELLARAEAISQSYESSLLQTNLVSARAMCAFLTGRIAESLPLCYEADQLHRTSSVDSEYHHRFTIAAARIGVLLQLGEYRRADSELQVYLQEARDTENTNAELHISMAQAWADVNAARAEQAVARLDAQRSQLPQQSFGFLHVLHMISVLRVGSATGQLEWAIESTADHWRKFQASVVRSSDAFSMFSYEAHARLLLNRCARDGAGRDAGRVVASHQRALARCNRADAYAEVSRIQARLAVLTGDRVAAQRHLEASIAGFTKWGARDQAARDSYALGCLLGGERAVAMMQTALETLTRLGVVEPLQDLRGYFPELLETQA